MMSASAWLVMGWLAAGIGPPSEHPRPPPGGAQSRPPAPTLLQPLDLEEDQPASPAASVPNVPLSLEEDFLGPGGPLPPPAARGALVDGGVDCAPPAVAPAFLTLNTTPWTTVLVDGEPAGSTPLFRRPMPPGTHILTLSNPTRGLVASETVVLESGQLQKLNLVLLSGALQQVSVDPAAEGTLPEDCMDPGTSPGFLSVQTTPWAKITLDGRNVGSTPLFRHSLAPGDHVLRMVNDGPGGMNVQVRVSVTPGETVKVVYTR